MKIVLLAPSNVAGGAERVLTSLANQFSADKNDTWFIQFDKNSEFYSIDKAVHKISLGIEAGKRKGISKWLLFPKYYLSLKKTLEQIKPDVVISFLFLTNIVGAICCRKLNIPIILSERNDPNEYSSKQKIIMKLFYPLADGFVCQSDIVKDYMNSHYGVDNSTVIANPLNSTQVGECAKETEDVIISVGRLISQKNFKLLIDAFADISKDFPQYKLKIFGDGPLKNELQEHIANYNLEERVMLMGTIKDVIRINNKAKLFVLSSNFEGYPNVLAEAMANGMICIASDVASGTVRQLISHGVNGYLYPVGDKNTLVELLRLVMGSKEDYYELRKRASELYSKTTIDKIANQWIEYINVVIVQ